MMKNYSDRSETHFNHTQLKYGICLTKTCKDFYKRNTTRDLALTLEECLNETFWRDYQLKTRVTENYNCEKLKVDINLDTADIAVAVALFILLILNFVGSLQDFILRAKNKGNPFLTCFSIRHNWRRLVAPAGEGPEPRLTRLKGFYGIKTINIMLVIICHSVLPAAVDPINPRYLEEAYQTYPIMGNGTLVVQTFFVMSGFLLIYNMLIDAEKRPVTWVNLPKGILNRWLRLTPSYMVVLAITATWMRHFGSGPLFQALVLEEVESCRRDRWLHPLYINNWPSAGKPALKVLYFPDTYRKFLEWPGWAPPSRVSYCAYVLHVLLIKLIDGTRTTLVHLSFIHFLQGLSSCTVISFLSAVPLHLLVEAPFYQLVKLCTSGSPRISAPPQPEGEKPSNISVSSRC